LKSPNDYLGKTDHNIFSQEEANQIMGIDKEIMQTGMPKIVEEILTDTNNRKIVYLSHKKPLKNKKGHIVGILGVSTDITAAK